MDDRYRQTLDTLLEGFQIIGFDWTYRYVNPVAATQGQRTPAELEGVPMTTAYPGIDRTPLFAVLRQCMEHRTPASFESPFTQPGGSQRWFELRIQPVPEGLSVHSIDITDRVAAQNALQARSDSLEEQVALRTAELEASNRELEAFSYSVSHDLRAPLRSIVGFATALAEDCGGVLSETGQRHLSRIQAASQRMSRLIDDLLSLSRVTRATLTLEDVDVTALAHDVAAELVRADPARQVRWQIAGGLRVRCDRALARIVFGHLLGNAWKFTALTADACITVGRSADDPDALVVRDNGAGFDARYAGRLFTPFQRLHAVDEFPGTGIGLAIVKQILHKHGGRVSATASPGQGATIALSCGPHTLAPLDRVAGMDAQPGNSGE